MRAILFVLAMAFTAPSATAQTSFGPALVVNDEVITRYDIAQRARLLRLSGAPAGQAQNLAQEQLIGDVLKLGAARRIGLAPSDADVAKAVSDFAGARGMSPAQLGAGLRRAGVKRATLERALRAETAWVAAVRGRFGADAQPGGLEIDREIQSRDLGEMVEVVVIQGSGRGARGALREAVAQAPDCQTAPAVAQALGLSTTRSQPSPVANLDPLLKNAIAGLEPGEVSQPVAAGPRSAAFVVCSRGDAMDSPEARAALGSTMRSKRLERLAEGWLQELRAQAVIDRK